MTSDGTVWSCPLCQGGNVPEIHRDSLRSYLQCHDCQLIFVPPCYHYNREDEKARYDLHQNHPDDPEYRKFLARLADPLVERIAEGSFGLDFGSGPGPTLSVMLNERGFPTSCYDPFYHPDESVWNRTFDFIVSSETFEHLHQPGIEIDRLFRVLKPEGWLAIMTKQVPPLDQFPQWHYIRDPVHVSFYHSESFRLIGKKWRATPHILSTEVVLLQKHQA